MNGLTRRKMLATAASVTMAGMAGCTSNNPRARDVQVSGLEDSSVYYEYVTQGTSDGSILSQPFDDGFMLALYFETDLGYEPDENVVYIQQGGETVTEIENGGSFLRPADSVRFHVPLYEPGSEERYQIISMNGPEKYDEFELTVSIRD